MNQSFEVFLLKLITGLREWKCRTGSPEWRNPRQRLQHQLGLWRRGHPRGLRLRGRQRGSSQSSRHPRVRRDEKVPLEKSSRIFSRTIPRGFLRLRHCLLRLLWYVLYISTQSYRPIGQFHKPIGAKGKCAGTHTELGS